MIICGYWCLWSHFMSLCPSVFLWAFLCSTRNEVRQRGKQALLLLLWLALTWNAVPLCGSARHVLGSELHLGPIYNGEFFLCRLLLLYAWAHLVALLGRLVPAQVVFTTVILRFPHVHCLLRLVEVGLWLVICLCQLLAPVAVFNLTRHLRLYSTPSLVHLITTIVTSNNCILNWRERHCTSHV